MSFRAVQTTLVGVDEHGRWPVRVSMRPRLHEVTRGYLRCPSCKEVGGGAIKESKSARDGSYFTCDVCRMTARLHD